MGTSERQVVAPAGLKDAAPSGYSHGVRVGETVYVSGQIGRTGDLEKQAEVALDGLRQVVEAAGGTMGDVVKLTIYTTETDCWERIREIRFRAIPQPWPSITLVVVHALAAPQLKIEVEAVAVIGSGR